MVFAAFVIETLLERSPGIAAEIITIIHDQLEPAFSRVRAVLSGGGVIVYPTDTFYGLGVDPENEQAVKRLFAIKKREPDQPILLLIADGRRVSDWTEEINEQAVHLMERYWPGPLTIVFKAKAHILPFLSAGTGTIGLRVPGNRLTLKLLEFLGSALTGTSANRSGAPSPAAIHELDRRLRERVDLILDAGPTAGGQPSTVVDVSSGHIRVVREGAVKI